MAPGVVVCWSGYEPRLQTIRLPPEGLVFGRDYASETDDRISREHVRVHVEDTVLYLQDLGSRNGTFINKWLNRQMRAPLPAVVRAGRTVFVVIKEIESYEQLHEGRWGAALDRARKEIAEAALAEQNVTVEAGSYNAIELVRSYCDTLGGEKVIYQPGINAPSLDESLTGTRPRVVVLQLTESALSFADMPTVGAWLETDARFVTVMWPGSNALSMVDPWVVERLRERVIEVANPRYDELPFRVRDIVTKHAPGIRIDASVCEGMLLKAQQFDEEWVVPRFTKAVADWYANRTPEATTLRMREIIHDIDPPPSGQHCLVGDPGRTSSF
jgi:FHA domain-containing protein